jgi:hypothetical protein
LARRLIVLSVHQKTQFSESLAGVEGASDIIRSRSRRGEERHFLVMANRQLE